MNESTAAVPAVLFEKLPNHVALVTLNRPAARNAVNGAVTATLDSIVRTTESDPEVWVVVITGAGEVFCAGADLKEIAAGRGESELMTPLNGFAGFVYARRTKPWIAAVNGKALAGGCEISLACDMVVASERAAFGLPEVSRGLIAAAGGLFRLPRTIPARIAIELILTAGEISAAAAHQHGMVNRVVPDDRVLHEALSLAQLITRNAPVAVRESLRVARSAADMTEDELRALSEECMARTMASEDMNEGPLAFIEKRAPRWTGK